MANDNRASYAKIGFTVFIGIVAIVLTLVYLGGLRSRHGEILVETYYDKPVTGLSVGSPVNFRGVRIGEVREINFVGGKYDVEGADNSRIYILMALECNRLGIPDDETHEAEDYVRLAVDKLGLRASVTSNGITGLSRIECDYHASEGAFAPEAPKISWTPQHTYVPAKISLFDNFGVAATKVMNQINRIDFGDVWSNINSSVQALARATDGAKTLIETRQGDFERLMDDLTATAASVKNLASELKRNPSLLIRERKSARLNETE